MCYVKCSKRIDKLSDSIVSIIFSEEDNFDEKDLQNKLNELTKDEKNDSDKSMATQAQIEELIHYTLKSFLQSDRVECIGKGQYKVKMAY